MASLFSIIGQYKSKLSMLPITILLFVVATFLLYLLFHSRKWVKYLPAAVGIVAGIILFFYGFSLKAQIVGLETLWKSVYFFVSGCIALATVWLLQLIESFSEPPVAKPAKHKAGPKKKR